MRSRLLWLVTAVALIAAPSLGWAQRTTGDIRGVITDESGAILPGVTVTLRGPAVQGMPTTVSNESGVYRFPNLAPGTYEISVELPGFATKTQTGITVALGATQEVPVQIERQHPAGDDHRRRRNAGGRLGHHQITTNYNREWVENAPVRRFTFFDLINAAPGVSARRRPTSSRSSSFGSATNENLYLLDGTDFTAPLTGAAWPWPNTDAIEEVQVLSLGAPAEYGNLAGRGVQRRDAPGQQQFHGDAQLLLPESDSLTGPQHHRRAGRAACRTTATSSRTCTVQLGGPLFKDKLWFFGSFQYQQDCGFAARHADPRSRPSRTPSATSTSSTTASTRTNRLQFQVHDDFYEIPEARHCRHGAERRHRRAAATTRRPACCTPRSSTRPPCSRLATPASTARMTRRSAERRSAGRPALPRPRHRQVTGGIYYWYDGKIVQDRLLPARSPSTPTTSWAVSHDFKVGVQYNSGGGESLTVTTTTSTPTAARSRYGYRRRCRTAQGGRMRAIGLYVDDTVRVGRADAEPRRPLRLQQGLLQFVPGSSIATETRLAQSPAVDKLFDWSTISPRLGVTFKLNEAGTTLLKAQLRALLPRHRHRRVRQRHAVDRAGLPLLRVLQCGWQSDAASS